jgi:mono/diheme cytochrome c family protein
MLAAVLAVSSQFAGAADKIDPKTGQTLHAKSCTSCHISMFGGDGGEMYVRHDHKVRNMNQLTSRVAACNANTGTGWFPEEEAHVAAYLNQKYYKFK